MLGLIKIGASVLNQTPFDWQGNCTNIRQAIALAKAQGVQLLCLPELCITGYGCEDVFFSPALQARALESLFEVAKETTSGFAVCIGLPLFFRNALYNVVALAVDGKVVGFVPKRHLAGDGVHYEPRWFKPWPRQVRAFWDDDRGCIPIGDLVFDLGGIRLGFEICEDAWGAHRPGVDLAERAVDVIFNPSASHFAFGKFEVRKRFVLEGSRAFGLAYVYSNLVGNEAGRLIYDGGAMIAASGELCVQGPRLCFSPVDVVSATVDMDRVRMLRAQVAATPSAVGDDPSGCVAVDFQMAQASLTPKTKFSGGWEYSKNIKEEEFTRAASLGLYDYLRKSHSKGFVVSLSGGADSAAVSVLVATMVKLGLTELGAERMLGELSLAGFDAKTGAVTASEIVNKILTCVYQSTRNSSETTRLAAAHLAEGLGAVYLELDIDTLVDSYCELVEQGIHKKLSWAEDDIALQNIQARVRAPAVWLIANLTGALLLATSNRSEISVGYATMDGDTAGSISPLAGIDKSFLRQWLKWMEEKGPACLGPFSYLKAINEQTPTAELRPRDFQQTDEADLMPYPVLNEIEALLVRDKCSPEEVLERLKLNHPEIPSNDLACWVKRFFTLWCRNQWKRERYAPSFHYDDRNLDPRSWCRFPILSGGYAEELSRL